MQETLQAITGQQIIEAIYYFIFIAVLTFLSKGWKPGGKDSDAKPILKFKGAAWLLSAKSFINTLITMPFWIGIFTKLRADPSIASATSNLTNGAQNLTSGVGGAASSISSGGFSFSPEMLFTNPLYGIGAVLLGVFILRMFARS